MENKDVNKTEGAAADQNVADKGKPQVKFRLSFDKDNGIMLQNKNQSNSRTADSATEEKADKNSAKPVVTRVRSACPICGSDKLIHSCHAIQEPVANERPNTQECDPKKILESATSISHSAMESRSDDDETPSFVVIHLGSAFIDRRFPPKSIMPWVMAEVKRSKDTFKEISLQVLSHTIKAVSYDDSVSKSMRTVFEHKLHGLSRFAKTHQDPRCFGYLRRESLYSDFECHVFLANDEKVVGIICIYILLVLLVGNGSKY